MISLFSKEYVIWYGRKIPLQFFFRLSIFSCRDLESIQKYRNLRFFAYVNLYR